MELNIISTIFLFLSTIFLLLLSSTLEEPSSFYDVLKHYKMPPGLLSGIKEYKLNDDTGKFKVRLKQKCKFTRGSYYFKYRKRIRGIIKRGLLTNLRGIKVKTHKRGKRIKTIFRRTDTDTDTDKGSNCSDTSTKKHDNLVFLSKKRSFTLPAKGFNKCPACQQKANSTLY